MKYTLRLFLLALIPGLAACGDDARSPIDPGAEPPAGFAVEIPATIIRGQAFTLNVTALDDTGVPETTWSGSVTLSASGGSLAPAAVQLVNGIATVQVTLSGHVGEVTLRASSGAVQSDPAAAMVLSGEAPARLEIVPASALLTGPGATQSFTVNAFDAQGAPTTAPQVTWTSNDPATLAIDASGVATAQTAIGSGMLVAAANGVESAPALVLIAQPATNAVLLADSQIMSAPAAVDPAAAYEPGWQYRVRVRGTAPAIGDVVIGTGAMPLAGRVLASSDAGNGETELTVELMPLNQLFTDLRMDEQIPMIEMDNASGVQPGPFGVGGIPPAYDAQMAEVEFKLGTFECKASGSVPSLDLPSPDIDINPDLHLRIGYTNGLDILAVVGTVSADAAYKPMFEATFEGSATCETVLKTFTIPATGIISLFYGVQVPLGIGFTLDGKLEIAEVGFDIKANATADVELGVTCATGACSGLTTFDMTRDGSLEFIAPDPSEQFRVELGAHAFVFARPFMGSLFTSALSFEFIDATAGLKQTVDLATTFYQVEDTAYASSFNLQFLANIGAGKDLQSAMDKLGKLLGTDLSTTLDVLEVDDTLATSPKGTFTISPATVQPGDSTTLGDMATFTVDLDPVTYLGVSSVDKVEFFWKHENDSTFTLGSGRPSCVEVDAGSGRTSFECKTDFLDDTPGEQTFYAFVHARMFGVPLPIPLEVAVDGRATVQVAALCPTDYPDPEYYGPTGIFQDIREWGGDGEILYADYGRVGYAGSVAGDGTGDWLSVRGDLSTDDWVFIRPLSAYSGFLTLNMRVYAYVEAMASDEFVEASAHAAVGFASVWLDVDAVESIGTPVVAVVDTIVTRRLDGDGGNVGEWMQLGTSVIANTRTRGSTSHTGSARAEMQVGILKTATDSNGRIVPIQVCSVSGATY